ncbi:hypothetical protein M9H77_17815 [Catharanthus roseus]|uniref:Uncharacterized protein n=1 Tax=Catharanthus roseus TaxID=4058 RepID=A0ACC0B5Q7_CATRO|nr:hypothetical protein M9H77_17815 [Catharanthus roseus]
MAVILDDSFKKEGEVPFKWEIRPGVPKPQEHIEYSSRKHLKNQAEDDNDDEFSFPSRKLAPPPAATRNGSFRSAPPPSRPEPVCVSRSGCFPSSSLTRNYNEKKRHSKTKKSEVDSDLETLSGRWSFSSRKSSLLSPFRDSPDLSSSFSSCQSTPKLHMNDANWAGYGLF